MWMLQHNHYTYMCQALRRTKSGSCLVKIRQCEVFVSSLQSLQLLLQSWVLAKVRALSMQIATSLKRPSTHYLGVGAGVSRREEVKKVVRGAFFYFLWSFLVFLWTCYVFRQTVRKSNSSLSSCCFYEKLCGYEETILVPGYSVSEAYEVGKTGWLGIKKTFQYSENQKGSAMGITWAYQTSFAQVSSDSTPCEDLRGTFRHQKGSAG